MRVTGHWAIGSSRSWRRVLGTGLIVVALAGVVTGRDAPRGQTVLVAARDLPGNHPLEPGDLRVEQIEASPDVVARLLRPPDRALQGSVLLHPVPRHALVHQGWVSRIPSAGREISVPLAPEHALGGALRPGERIDVLATFARNGERARTVVVARSAEVVAVHRGSGTLTGAGGEITAVTLSVSPVEAVELAFALRTGELDVVRSTGAAELGPAANASSSLESATGGEPSAGRAVPAGAGRRVGPCARPSADPGVEGTGPGRPATGSAVCR